MAALSQSLLRLSMPLLALGLALPAQAGAPGKPVSHYNGRWTVSEDRPVFTARGKAYKTIDIAPCGKDFCGVSVADNGSCGPVLFRFLSAHAEEYQLRGHGKWGTQQKNVVIYANDEVNAGDGPWLEVYLGDGHNFGERSGNMPKFHANYKKLGGAKCSVR